MSPELEAFFTALDQYDSCIPIAELTVRLRELAIDLDDIRDFVHFSDEGYQRNLIRCGPAYQALILCWKNGQRSPVHDHEGSSCGVVVIQGTLTETCFKHDGSRERLQETGTCQLHQGNVCGSYDTDTHEIANVAPDGSDLVTMHIYSPPLGAVGIYDVEHNTYEKRHSPVAVFPQTVSR